MRAEEQLSLTGELARFVTSLSPERLPAEVLDDARWRLVDTVGVAVSGYQEGRIFIFRGAHLALFVDGCFWHGCPDHCRMPSSNREYCGAKDSRERGP